MSRPTPLLFHFIIPAGQENNFRLSGVWNGTPQEISPIQLLDGNFAVPSAILTNSDIPQEIKDAFQGLDIRQVNCCDFKVCNHEEGGA